MNRNVAGYNRIRLVCKTFQLLLWMQLFQQYMVLEKSGGSVRQTKVSNGAAWASPSGFCKASDAAPGRVPLQVRGHDLRSVSVTKNDSTSTKTYYYNESGQVAEIKKSDGSYTRFHYDSDNLEYEERYNASNQLTALFKYFYDSDDKVSYVLYKHSQFGSTKAYYDLYHYVYNGLGEITDIVKVQSQYDFNINPVQTPVAHYEYDPYGQIIEVNTYNNDNFGNINPIRYKGYYYDTDLDWYHLTSRYYDPSIGRFISPDDLDLLTESTGDITDKNLYSYCDNNPIMRADKGGELWNMVVCGAIGAAISATVEIASQVMSDGKVTNWGNVGRSAVSGAVSSMGIGGKIGSAVIDGVVAGYNTYKSSSGKNKWGKAILSGAVGAGLSWAGGDSAGKLLKGAKFSNKASKLEKKIKKSKIGRKIKKNRIYKRISNTKHVRRWRSRGRGYNKARTIFSGFAAWGSRTISSYFISRW